MYRILIIIFLFIAFPQACFGQSSEDKRRIEEEKRKDLSISELYLTEVEITPPQSESAQKAYFSKLLSTKAITLSDTLKTLSILTGIDGQYRDFDSQFSFFKQKDVFPSSLGAQPKGDRPLKKGEAAYIFVKALDIKGGITLRLFGASQRYALKELIYRGIMLPGSVQDFMSGKELILTLTQLADYMADKQKGGSI